MSPRSSAASNSAATPRPRRSRAQPRSRSASSVGELVAAGVEPLRVRPRNDVSAAARTRPDRCGCSSASSRASQSSAAGGQQHGHRRRRRPGRRARRAPRCDQPAVRRARRPGPRRVGPRSARRPTSRRRRAALAMSAAQSAAMCSAGVVGSGSVRACQLEAVAARPAAPGTAPGAAPRPAGSQGERRRRRGPRCADHRARRRGGPPGVARPGRRRCAGWCRASPAWCAVARGREVGDDVAAAEGVDRLLGVADQHHRGVAREGAVEDLPLHRVGVLELVDQHDLPPLPHPRRGPARRRPRARRPAGRAGRRSDRIPRRRLRRSTSARTSCAKATRAPRPPGRAPPAAASSACASPTTVRASVRAVGAIERRRPPARWPKLAQVDVVDHLDDAGRRATRPAWRRCRCRRRRPASGARSGRTGGWSRWWRRRTTPARRGARR